MDQNLILIAVITTAVTALVAVVALITLRRRLTSFKSGKLQVGAQPREMEANMVKVTDGSQIDLLKGTSTSAKAVTVDGQSVYRTRDANEQPLLRPAPKDEGSTGA
ncbi:hypothetical protein [Micromonospora sp. NPDC004704]